MHSHGTYIHMHFEAKSSDQQLSSEHNFSIYHGNKNMITLNPGESSYEVNSCVWEGPEVDLYVIRGQANFREWMHTKDN